MFIIHKMAFVKRLSVESNFMNSLFGIATLCNWLKNLAPLSTNQRKSKPILLWLACMCFLPLGADYLCLPTVACVFIGLMTNYHYSNFWPLLPSQLLLLTKDFSPVWQCLQIYCLEKEPITDMYSTWWNKHYINLEEIVLPGEELQLAFFFCENASVVVAVWLSMQTLNLKYPEILNIILC